MYQPVQQNQQWQQQPGISSAPEQQGQQWQQQPATAYVPQPQPSAPSIENVPPPSYDAVMGQTTLDK